MRETKCVKRDARNAMLEREARKADGRFSRFTLHVSRITFHFFVSFRVFRG